MPFAAMAKRYYEQVIMNASISNSASASINEATFVDEITTSMQRYNYTVTEKSPLESDVDKVISKRIMGYLDEFFKTNHKLMKTRKSKSSASVRKTRRH